MNKQKPKKRKSTQLGLNQPPTLPGTQPNESSGDEEDPPNRALLAAITALRGEMTKIKDDICENLERRIERVYNDLRAEIVTTNNIAQVSITNLEAKSQTLQAKITDIEEAATTHSDSISQLEQQVANLSAEVVSLKQKNEDLEGRSRRNNIRITGVREGSEATKPRDFIANLLKDVLSLDEAPLIDRAHRTLRQRPNPSDPPRPFVIRLHYCHVLEDILRKAAAMRNLQYQARFLVTHNGSQLSFTDPQKAEEYAERLIAIPSGSTGRS
ncbi:unnamed protein product [Leuciscus chuanchicus]